MYICPGGFDPRGLAGDHRAFLAELRRFSDLYGLSTTMSEVENRSDRHSSRWTIATRAAEWSVDTIYEFLHWNDLIQRDFARPVWWKIVYAFRAAGICLTNGMLAKIAAAHWRSAGFLLFPYILFLLLTVLAAVFGFVTAELLARNAALPWYVDVSAGTTAGAVFFIAVLRTAEPHLKILYMFDAIVSTYEFAHRKRPDWEERLQIFARYLVEAASRKDIDEIVIAGYSSGSFLAVDMLDRALAIDPMLGRHGPRVCLLTMAANLPLVGFNPAAGWFRDRLRRLAVEPSIDWIDYQSRKDIVNFYKFDPIVGHGIDVGSQRVNPTVILVRFRDIISPQSYGRFRWQLFRIHFQFVMANDRPAHYDYFMIVCGPYDLRYRADHPEEVTAAARAQAQAKLALEPS